MFAMSPLKFEPVLVSQLIASGLALMVAFGLPVSDEQRQAILQFAGVAIAIFLGGGLVSRSIAWSPASVEIEVTDAYLAGVDEGKDVARKEMQHGAVNA